MAIAALPSCQPSPDHTPTVAPVANVAPDHWTTGDKVAIGTSVTRQSNVWFTAVHGTVADVMYPTIDVDNLRQFGYLVTDGSSFFFDSMSERPGVSAIVTIADQRALMYQLRVDDYDHHFSIVTDLATSSVAPVVVLRTQLFGDNVSKLHVYAYLVPHLAGSGAGQTAFFEGDRGYVSKGETWLAVGDDAAMGVRTAGYLGHGDGYDQLHQHAIPNQYDRAGPGRVTLTWELPSAGPWTTALAFGNTRAAADAALGPVISQTGGAQAAFNAYRDGWSRYAATLTAPPHATPLFFYSAEVIKMAEDKLHPGAIVASLALPWGDTVTDDSGDVGYRKVWPRDLYHAASGLLAAGDAATAYDVLRFMGKQQQADGSMPQNTNLEGKPVWTGQQLDETADAILLAVRLTGKASGPDIARAADYLVKNGPATQQERWEEASGYSPSTIASGIAALRAAARWSARTGQSADRAAAWLVAAATWDTSLESWTLTHTGPLGSGYYLRVSPDGRPDSAELVDLANGGGVWDQREIVDPSFLELVRLGVRPAKDPRITATIQVVDANISRRDGGYPSWYRYPHDGYGEKNEGSAPPGLGHLWPLLSGERGVYDVMAGGQNPGFFQGELENLAGGNELIPEQVWESSGVPTGSARPLVWAHAEYIILAKAVATGVVDDSPANWLI